MIKTNSKIREAFHAVYNSLCDHGIVYPKERWRLLEIMDAALLKQPVRNCEVGTPEEQAERYAAHCSMFPQCAGCPCCGKVSYGKCEFAWGQMPYVANEKGGEDDTNGRAIQQQGGV